MSSSPTKLYVNRLSETAKLPTRGSPFSAGLDLCADKSYVIEPMGIQLVNTGLAMVIPEGYYGRIAPRSGMSVKTGLIVNAGVIDSDYRGHVKILFQNHTNNAVNINQGDKVAQIIIEKIALLDVQEVEELEELENTARGVNGFGSTGY
jgi:dUTP pyrophosphatase